MVHQNDEPWFADTNDYNHSQVRIAITDAILFHSKESTMPFRRNPEPGRIATIFFATAFVIVAGAASCVFIIVTSVQKLTLPLLAWGALFTGVILLLLAIVFPRNNDSSRRKFQFWLSSQDRTDPTKAYRVGKRRSSEPLAYGTNKPPTAESVREAADQGAAVYWVPHATSNGKEKPQQ